MTEPITETSEQESQAGTEQTEPKAFDAEYVDKLRKEAAKYRTEAKTNSDAARKLAAIEESQKSEAQKNADKLAAAEKDATDARREALKFKIAAKFAIDDEAADALLTGNDEATMTRQAELFTTAQGERKKQGNRVPKEGTSTQSGTDDMREFTRSLFGAGD